MNRFVIAEPNKCIGCRTCEVACALAHPLGDGTAQALSPANFKPRLRLVKNLKTTAPVQCRQCENAPCVNACPTKALTYRSGTVQLIESRCIGCQTCVLACPFGAMDHHSSSGSRTKSWLILCSFDHLGCAQVRPVYRRRHRPNLYSVLPDRSPVHPTQSSRSGSYQQQTARKNPHQHATNAVRRMGSAFVFAK